ncbi:MAG: glycine zipper 2TM domain-containing protein [Betaproteobacteria bacterium]|nr:glycine zipper 2TM domain-containing protein [Betaproteobacteria bacterium]
MTRTLGIVAVLAAALIAAGCATGRSGAAYTRDQARQESNVRMGMVESVRQVTIEGTRSGVGAVAGGAVGGIAGSSVGHGKGAQVGAVLGAVGGGVAGQAIEEATTRKPGIEITVKLDSGQMIAITQEADETFRPGEQVRVLSGGGVSRVSH